jgi:PAS domain S-box-containing protein
VLVVDDRALLGPAIGEALEGWTHQAEVASARDALELVRRHRFDLALVDVTPSDGAPEAVIRALRAGDSETAILVVAALDDHESIRRAYEAGADDFVCWPLRDVELRLRIRALEKLKRRADHGQVMLGLTRTLSSSLRFEEILFEVVRCIAEVVRVDRCSIVLTSDSQRGYVVASSEDPAVRDLPLDLTKYPEVLKALGDGQPLVIDVGTDPLLDEVRPHIPPDGPATSAIFPISHESRPMGVLFLRFAARREDLAEHDLEFCQTVANATAISLRNARIVSALEDEHARVTLERSEAERKLEVLSHYVDFFESSADGMLVVERAGRVLYANPRIAALTGLSVDEIRTRDLSALVVEEEVPVVARLLEEFGRGNYPKEVDLRWKGAGGSQLVLELSASSTVRLAQGVLLVLRDVTAARATAAELRRTTEFLEGLINQSVDAIIAADMNGGILLFNPAAERILGYSAKDVLGRPMIEQFYPPGVARQIMRKLRSDEFGGQGRLEQTRAVIVAEDGAEVPISMTAGMIFEDGEARATFGIFTDMRRLVEVENDLARTRLELMERERQAIAAQLAGATAHELNQPLTFVMASVELLRRKLRSMPPDCDDIVETIMAETDRMAQIVRKIGRITHYETKAYVGSTRILDIDAATAPVDEDGDTAMMQRPNLSALPRRTDDDEEEDTDAGTSPALPDVGANGGGAGTDEHTAPGQAAPSAASGETEGEDREDDP